MKTTLLLLMFAFAVSSLTLWLIRSPLSWALYFFEATLIVVLCYGLLHDSRSKTYEERTIGFSVCRFVDYLMVICAILLLFLSLVGATGSYVGVILSVIVVLYLPGWALIRIFHLFDSLGGIGLLVLPLVLSVPISCAMISILLAVHHADGFLLLLIYLALSIVSPIKARLGHEKWRSERIFPFSLSALILAWIAVFFFFVIMTLYPQAALVPNSDIVEHFSSARQLILATHAYQGGELWFHLTQSSIFLLSGPTMQIFQSITAFLSIFSILSFYVMSQAYLADVDHRLPPLATLFWGIFSGFGWLYFVLESTFNPATSSYYGLLYDTSTRSYWDVGYGQGWIWLWFRPLTLGLTLFFVLLYLLQEQRLSPRSYVLTCTLLLLTLNFVHFSESMIFVFFLVTLSVVKLDRRLRVKETAISSTIAMMLSPLLLVIYQSTFGMSIVAPLPNHLVLLALASVLALFLTRLGSRSAIWRRSITRAIVAGSLIVYFWLLITWLVTAKDFSTVEVEEALSVPWQLYPVLLGLGGLFALFSMRTILKSQSKHPVVLFLILSLFGVLLGRLLTGYNLYASGTGYWERRIIPVVYAGASVLAPISIIGLFKSIQGKRRIILAVFLSSLVISGVASTFLTLELRIYHSERLALSDSDLGVVNALNKLDADKILLTATDFSRYVAEFAPSSWVIDRYRYQLWPATCPELPLHVLYSMDKQVCVLLRGDDTREIHQKYSLGYLATHILPLLTSNNSVSVASLPEMVAPSFNSKTLLVLPEYQDPVFWYAYDILSQSSYNYSIALTDDLETISKAQTLVAPTENVAAQLIQYKELFDFNFSRLVVLNLDGYGDLASNYFSNAKMTIFLDEESEQKASFMYHGRNTDRIDSVVSPVEFEVQSSYEKGVSATSLLENLDGWTASALGSGNISAPVLSLSGEDYQAGGTSMNLTVGSGDFAYWQIERNLDGPIDVGDSDFIFFYWYGKGDGKWYVLDFVSGTSGDYWYRFRDTWNGWKMVRIPMHVKDGGYSFNGVSFDKYTNGNPEWNKIVKVQLRNEASNPNLQGVFRIGHLGFESVPITTFTAVMEGSNNARLLNYNGTSWNQLANLSTNETVLLSEYTLMNGASSSLIFGASNCLNVTMTMKPDVSLVAVSIKLPPFLGAASGSSVKLKLVPEISPMLELNEIANSAASLPLPITIHSLPLPTNESVDAWYIGKEGRVPLSIEDRKRELEIIYLNVYPLIDSIELEKGNYAVVGRIMGFSNINTSLDKAKTKAENPVQGNLATFKEADFEGNVTICSNASMIVQGQDSLLKATLDGYEVQGISKIVFFNDSGVMKMTEANLSGGRGFYAYVRSSSQISYSCSKPNCTALITFGNNTERLENIHSHEVLINGRSLVTLRQPTLQVEGNVTFQDLYAYAELYRTLGAIDSNVSINGRVFFEMTFGDTFTVVNNFRYEGQVALSPERHRYDELGPLVKSFPLLLVMIACYVAYRIVRPQKRAIKISWRSGH